MRTAQKAALSLIPSGRTGDPWTTTEEEILCRTDITVVEMCFMLNRSYGSVVSRRSRVRRSQAKPKPQQAQSSWRESRRTPSELCLMREVFNMVDHGVNMKTACEHVARKYSSNSDDLYPRLFVACCDDQLVKQFFPKRLTYPKPKPPSEIEKQLECVLVYLYREVLEIPAFGRLIEQLEYMSTKYRLSKRDAWVIQNMVNKFQLKITMEGERL